jgi:hypothetical protein
MSGQEEPNACMKTKILKLTRLTHLYLGVFIAPAVLFFAFTGVLQTFSLHETTKGSSYEPPNWIVVLAQIHKKQTPLVPARKPQPVAAAKTDGAKPRRHNVEAPPAASKPAHNSLPLKLFFLIVGVGLVTSTFSGLYMTYKFTRKKPILVVLLLGGVAVPMVLMAI